jgi:hypothetical protein
MRTFKTIHVLGLLTGKLLDEESTVDDLTEVLVFLCGVQTPQHQLAKDHIFAIDNVNRVVYSESLFFHHTLLREIIKNIPNLRTTEEWYAWAEVNVKILGQELLLERAERTFVVPPPERTGSIKFYVN